VYFGAVFEIKNEIPDERAGLEITSKRSLVRFLVVDDFEPFRRFVCSTLGRRPDSQDVGEASDGLEAVQKAVELRPDLILLDIGLPSLNGIEVARQMRSLVPESKIIFLTQESSAEVMQEALNLGAGGYVIKITAASELLTAVETVLSGKTFVSSTEPKLEIDSSAMCEKLWTLPQTVDATPPLVA
jgi:DNA-binding NarL/FixJ family response regulator